MMEIIEAAGDPLADLEAWRPEVGQALAVTNTHALEDVAAEIAAGQKGLMRILDRGRPAGVVVVGVLRFPLCRVLNVWLLAGHGVLGGYADITADLSRLAEQRRCDRIWGSGREGWCRFDGRAGWRTLSRTMEYSL